MKRRLLFIDGNNTDWLMEFLKERFRSLTVHVVHDLESARRACVDYGCDIILTNLSITDGDSPTAIVHTLQSYAPGVPLIGILAHVNDDDHMAVLGLGVRHVLFLADVQHDKDIFTKALITTLQEIASRDTHRDVFNDQFKALSGKVWDVDGRTKAMETILGTLTLSIDKMTQAIDKRGGLEDRVKALEHTNTLAVKVLIGIGGCVGTLLTVAGTVFVAWLKK